MRKNILFFVFVILLVGIIGCDTSKKVAYLQGSDKLSESELTGKPTILHDAKILPKDLLTITVITTDPEAARPFNLTSPTFVTGGGSEVIAQPSLQPYLVDNNGQINFPILGKISLGGLNKEEAENKIEGLLKAYLKEEPVVTINFQNYKISVIGEVETPGTFTIPNQKINIFEALSLAGDMTIYGRRDNVKIIREDVNGKKNIITLNLNNAEIIYSPYYYLQQNDVIYVEPNNVVAQNSLIGPMTNLWVSVSSVLVSVASLLAIILKK